MGKIEQRVRKRYSFFRNRGVTLSFDIHIAKNGHEIEALRPDWTALQTHPNADLDFFQLVMRERSHILRPNVIALKQGDAIKAIVAGRIEDANIEVRFGYKTICAPQVRTLTVVFGGLLGEQSNEVASTILNELMRSLKGREADVVRLSSIRTDSELYRLARLIPKVACRSHFVEHRPHWKLELPHSLDQVFSRLTRDHRQQLKRKSKNFEKAYPNTIEVRCVSSAEDVGRFCDDVEEIAKHTYQRGLGAGFIDGPETRRRLLLEAGRGQLRLYILYVDQKPIAYWWGTIYSQIFHSNALGYDSALAKYSPGMYLMVKVIADLCQLRVRAVDFGLGDARYKQQLGTQSWEEATIYVFAPRFRPVMLNACSTLGEAASLYARKILGRFRLLDLVKRNWRHRLTPSNGEAHNSP